MKKTFSILLTALLCTAVLALAGCKALEKKNAAERTVTTAMNALLKGDLKTYIDTFDLNDEQKAQLIPFFEEKLGPEIEKHGGIKDYKIEEKEFDEENGTASYTVTIFYGDGTEESKTIDMVRTNAGLWKQKPISK